MKTTKTMKTCCALIGAAGVLTTQNLFADFISIAQGPGGNDNGGSFYATTGNLGSFYTFCLEDSEFISYNTPYTYVVNSGAVDGGFSTGPGGTPTFDPLSIGTAYLYSQFRSGADGAITPTLGNTLQNAIWWLEGETVPAPGAHVVLSADAAALITATAITLGFGSDTNALKVNANGAYGVVALNVYDANGGLVQDQLAIVPEASTMIAGALLLLPLGVSALRIVRKNRIA